MSYTQPTTYSYRITVAIYSLLTTWATKTATLTPALTSAVEDVLSDITITWKILVNDQGCHLSASIDGTARTYLPMHPTPDAPGSLTMLADQIGVNLAQIMQTTARIDILPSFREMVWRTEPELSRHPSCMNTTALAGAALSAEMQGSASSSTAPAPCPETHVSARSNHLQPGATVMIPTAVNFQTYVLGTKLDNCDIWVIGEPFTAPSTLTIIGALEAPSPFAAVAAWIAITQGVDPDRITMHKLQEQSHMWRFSIG